MHDERAGPGWWARGFRFRTGLVAIGVLIAAVLWGMVPSGEDRWEAIERAVERQQWDDAERRLARWVERHPDDDQARVQLGLSLVSLGRDDEAQRVLDGLSPESPVGTQAELLRGTMAMKRCDRRGSEQRFRTIIERDPGQVEARARLITLLLMQCRIEEVRAILWEFFEETHDPRQLVALSKMALEARQPELFRDLVGEGERLRRRLDRFLNQSPDDPWLRRARGLFQYELGDPTGAVADLQFARQFIEADSTVALALAECLVTLGEAEQADEALGSLPERPVQQARWWILHGRIEQGRGREEEAIACFSEAVAADPHHLGAHYRLSQALRNAGQAEKAGPILDRAEEIRSRTIALKTALDEAPNTLEDAEQCKRLGQSFLELGMPAEARLWFERGSRLDPFDRESQNALIMLADASPDVSSLPQLRAGVTASATIPRLPSDESSTVPGPRFEDEAASRGLIFTYESGAKGDLFIADIMGGGVALFDYDNDGWLDVYFVNGCPLPVDPDDPPSPNRLFRNNGDGTFTDVTEFAGVGGRGYGMGCAVGDIDGDGFDDLFVTGFGSTVLYRNNGDGSFTDITESAGVFSDRWSTAAGFADLDGDGDLDLVVVTYVEADPETAPECRDASGRRIHCPPGRFSPQFEMLFRNDGDCKFTDVSAEAGVELPDGPALGLAIADLDGDGMLDLFVANDVMPDFLFLNRGRLRFEEVGVASGTAFDAAGRATASMGVVADDLNGDGLIDLFHTNFRNEQNTLLQNLGGGQFVDATTGSGLDGPSLLVTGFGSVALDATNDGTLDLFVANGHVFDQPWINQPMAQLPHWYTGRGDGRYTIANDGSAGPYFDHPVIGRGVASGDLDNDGRVDLVVVHRDEPASLLRNVTPDPGHWLGVRLIGSDSGPDPVGARVTCQVGERSITRWRTAGTSYLSSSDPRLWFGLGASETIDRLEVRWPSGAVQQFQDLPADQIIQIREADRTMTPTLVPGRG